MGSNSFSLRNSLPIMILPSLNDYLGRSAQPPLKRDWVNLGLSELFKKILYGDVEIYQPKIEPPDSPVDPITSLEPPSLPEHSK
jgi:hypothetical protein